MKIAITGASGKTGYRITEEAVKKGIKVKQIVRKNSKLPDNLKRVVLPQPEGPRSPNNCPFSIFKLIAFNIQLENF